MTTQPAGRPLQRHVYFLVGIVALIMAGSLGYSTFVVHQITARYSPLADAVQECRFETTTAHLWFEEILSGDRHENIEIVWQRLDNAEHCGRIILEGGESPYGTFVPLRDPQLRGDVEDLLEKLARFRAMAEERFSTRQDAQPGSEIDQQFDAIFHDFNTIAYKIEKQLRGHLHAKLVHFRMLQVALFASIFVPVFFAIWMIRRHNRLLVRDRIAMQENERLLLESQNAAQIGSYVLDVKTGVWNSSPVLDLIFGIETDYERSLEGWLAIVHPDDRRSMTEYINQGVLEAPDRFQQECRIIRHDNGMERYVEILGKLEFDAGGQPLRMLGTIQDITERNKSDSMLLESRERLDLALDGAELGIWDWDMENDRVVYDERAAEMLGYSLAEIGSHLDAWKERVHPDDLPRAQETLTAHLEDKTPIYESEHRLRHKSGRWIWVHDRGRVVSRGKDGEPLRVTGTQLDITDRILLAQERGNLEGQLVRAQKMEAIGTLAGGIAHDFANILMPILGYTELALNRLEAGDESREYLSQVMRAAHRANDLVKQILTFSRQDEEERHPVILSLILKEVLQLLRSTLPTTIEIRQKIDTGCRPVAASPTQMHQVMMNLCTNAYHAIGEEGGVIDVSMEMVDLDADITQLHPHLNEGAHVRISVSDTGHGIDKATIDKIFEPFYTTKPQGKGTGLGLSVVHGIIANHGGAISVHSEPGKGTVFRIFLPVMERYAELDVPESRKPQEGTESILFVDDEPQIATLGKEMLEKFGYTVTVRTSAMEALEAFRGNPDRFDIVITDQTMPNMTGVRLATELARIRPHIPVILISGFSEIMAAEIESVPIIRERITKPILARDLAGAIRRVLDEPA